MQPWKKNAPTVIKMSKAFYSNNLKGQRNSSDYPTNLQRQMGNGQSARVPKSLACENKQKVSKCSLNNPLKIKCLAKWSIEHFL